MVLGCIASPFAAAATTFIASFAVSPILRDGAAGRPASRLDEAAAMAIGVWFLAVIIVVAAALPIVIWMTRRGTLSLQRVLLLGAGLGMLPVAIGAASSFVAGVVGEPSRGMPASVTAPFIMTLLGIVTGVCSAWTFWSVAVRGAD